MAGFQAEMDSALVSRLTQPDQKLMKSKEIEGGKKSSEWPWWLGLELKKLKNQGGPWWKRFYFSRLTPTVVGSTCFFCLDERIESSHTLIFLPLKCYENKHWPTFQTSTGMHNKLYTEHRQQCGIVAWHQLLFFQERSKRNHFHSVWEIVSMEWQQQFMHSFMIMRPLWGTEENPYLRRTQCGQVQDL